MDGILISNVRKDYRLGRNTVTIFSDLTMTIAPGDFVAIVGPSGSGKSTLLNLIGGIDRPDQGEIDFEHARLSRMSESALARWRAANVGFVFQFYNLMPMLTAEQNVELPLLLTSLSARQRRERVETLLSMLGLADRRRHLPSELSGGQQQRVGIARALASDPKLLLCDEPTGDLDRESADEVLTMLRILNTELGKTIVMVTHDDAAARSARRQLRLDKGKFIEAEAA
ncbi:ABC transporter ATP-binding protein [Rhizobium lusitanum]|jgi:putative ABC transport system ATP-binding protein|uniref:Putative ABC transport system ATP-binding protein n=1 Tax=Rhizobium lusitanum TaxID=293958 RepID=A0A1C3WW36_9HYPH|nr:ABC transporter ATP-binding protein [Rhizobium lusitanum]NTJ10708.1 ABC transporter ATP-binding protein [Rhizobium lusitanum]SCB44212.1 putative ABC transport system ATP-binding protein [Rhizobium lusitanum]